MAVEHFLVGLDELVGHLVGVVDAFSFGEGKEIAQIAPAVLDGGGRVVVDIHPLEVQLDLAGKGGHGVTPLKTSSQERKPSEPDCRHVR